MVHKLSIFLYIMFNLHTRIFSYCLIRLLMFCAHCNTFVNSTHTVTRSTLLSFTSLIFNPFWSLLSPWMTDTSCPYKFTSNAGERLGLKCGASIPPNSLLSSAIFKTHSVCCTSFCTNSWNKLNNFMNILVNYNLLTGGTLKHSRTYNHTLQVNQNAPTCSEK